MARTAKLEPHFDHTSQRWVLNVPASLSETGHRHRVYFPRGEEQAAITHADNLKKAKTALKGKAKHAKPELIEAAVKWEAVVTELGYRNLDHFCADRVADLEKTSKSPTFENLIDTFVLDHSKNWSDDYKRKRWKPFRKRLSEIEELRISSMDEAFWREWFATWSKTDKPGKDTYNQQLGMVRSLFELRAAKLVWALNPLDDLPAKKGRGKQSVPVSAPEDVHKLLLLAWEHDRDMVPYFATCYFAGPRPDSEAKTLRFEHYNWTEGHLKIGITKTNHAPQRYVPIEDALREWMRPWLKKKGSIIPSNFTKRRRRLIYGYYTTPGASMGDESAWKQFVPWGHDISRHSYGSYWEAEHRGEPGCREMIVAQMGHENFKTFNSYYLNARTKKEAEAFWASRPPKEQSNVIAIA